jgi:P-type Ca2+ transporter type 2C
VQLSSRAAIRVKRGGQETSLNGEELVSGDIITLSAGDLVPAAARLIEALQLRVKEATLSGKGNAIDKQVSALPTATPLDERRSMVYLGTTIESGSGVPVVVATGASTELGKIADVKGDEGNARRKTDACH